MQQRLLLLVIAAVPFCALGGGLVGAATVAYKRVSLPVAAAGLAAYVAYQQTR